LRNQRAETSAVPPHFTSASQQTPRRVRSHPHAITGVPGDGLHKSNSLQPATLGMYSNVLSFAPLTLRQLSLKLCSAYFFPVNVFSHFMVFVCGCQVFSIEQPLLLPFRCAEECLRPSLKTFRPQAFEAPEAFRNPAGSSLSR